MKPVFFDLETLYLFRDLGLSNNGRDPSLLRIAVAGVLSDSVEFYTEDAASSLFEALDEADLIVGFNVLGFDYAVLQPYAGFNVKAKYSQKTLDMFDYLRNMTGAWCGLDKLCELNTGHRKNADTLKIPEMWRSGQHEEVKKYLKNDLEMTQSLFDHVNENGMLQYEHKVRGKNYGVKEIRFKWEIPTNPRQ